jgi:glycosyltransferase involved in cell wall biosynthesis
MNQSRHRILLMHPMDPRGGKLGGIETHVRMILSRHPKDFSVLFVGVDEFGDCPLGEVRKVEIDGRTVDFLPVVHIAASKINLASRKLTGSTTFRFALGALRFLPKLRALTKDQAISADLQRFEFAILPKLLGLRTIQMVHGEGSKEQKMDSLIKKLWFVHRLNETVALTLANKVLCVNPNIITRLEKILPRAAAKAEVMTVSVDTQRFAPSPFDTRDGVFRVVFAGRLDEFKDPPLMFRVLAGLRDRLGGKLEFHYVGSTDPTRYPEFADIDAITVRHGVQSADGVAGIVAKCHAGVLTSYFEGMPCYLLETLSAGRPFCAIRLPQYDPLVVAGVSGELIERTEPVDDSLAKLVDAFVRLRDDIFAGRIDPDRVHQRVAPYSIETQMSRLFAHHRALQGGVSKTGGATSMSEARTAG